jgi:hypothetical protein
MAWRAFRAARIIAANPPRAIGELRAGPTEVKGVLHGEAQVQAVLSQRNCLYSRLLIEQYRRNRWEPVLERREVTGVWLDDGSGRVWVNPREAQVIVSSPRRVQVGIFEVPSPELTQLLERLNEQPEILGPFVRWREEVLEDGDVLHAVGAARRGATGEAQEGEAQEGAWAIHGTGSFHVLSDRDDAEVIRMWQRNGQQRAAAAVLGGLLALWGLWNVISGA